MEKFINVSQKVLLPDGVKYSPLFVNVKYIIDFSKSGDGETIINYYGKNTKVIISETIEELQKLINS